MKLISSDEVCTAKGRKGRQAAAVFLVLCILTAIVVYSHMDWERNLIMTDSTHENIVYLKMDNADFIPEHKVMFCIYDSDSHEIQLCLKEFSKDKRFFQFRPAAVEYYVDDRKIDSCSWLSQTEWWGKYDIVLLKNVSDFETIKCVYDKNNDKIFKAFYGGNE